MQNETPQVNTRLKDLLLPAYGPCPAFDSVCSDMRWSPAEGHVPRGFSGATGELREVELVLVCAEPGDPHTGERHDAGTTEEWYLRSTSSYSYKCLREGTDLFHRNIRLILKLCWPELEIGPQLRKTWITDSVLCSAKTEGGKVSGAIEQECRRRYLERQLAAMPWALVVALGGKAYERLKGIPGVLKAISAAPPGCNYRQARPSWEQVARTVRSRTT
jgi:hypothetical protein